MLPRWAEITIGTVLIVSTVLAISALLNMGNEPTTYIHGDADYSNSLPQRYVDIIRESRDNTSYEIPEEELCRWRGDCER